MVIYLFGSRFSLAVHGHIEFADLIKNRWYNLAGNVYIILNKMSQMQFRMMIEHVSELGHHFYTKKKNPTIFFLFQPGLYQLEYSSQNNN